MTRASTITLDTSTDLESIASMALRCNKIEHGWQVSEHGCDDWLPVERVPTTVHLDLIANDRIPDPSKDFNEHSIQWVGERSWTYRVALPSVHRAHGLQHILVLQGLDTFAHIKLNGKTLHRSDNMWIPIQLDVTDLLHQKTNILDIDFASALLKARDIKDIHSEHKWVGSNGEHSRYAVRKAQYHWGWDWGPVLMTCGPWRSVYLQSYHARISNIWLDYDLGDDLDVAKGTLHASIHSLETFKVVFSIYSATDELVFTETTTCDSDGVAEVTFHVKRPALWWPHQYGSQTRYRMCAYVYSAEGLELHKMDRLMGFRRIELVQENDDFGKSFYFKINNVPVFAGGANWIPADSHLPSISSDRYRKWLQLARDGNLSMIRIWGGGTYEDDAFYDCCDELGLLVWQDFMFACGNYPCFPDFLQSVTKEAVAQLERLRHHPSIVLYTGNNEDYQIAEDSGLKYSPDDRDPESWLKTDFPARYIYEKLLLEAVQQHAPHCAYHPGSPWSDGRPTSDSTAGDTHMWQVYHGAQHKYQSYPQLGSRFVSEFGMPSLPHMDTLRSCITNSAEIRPGSRAVEFRNKAGNHARIMAGYMHENLRVHGDMRRYIHLTQLVQSEAMTCAFRAWRRQWKDRRCGGALVWQLNDVWPGTSWSVADYFLRRKMAYHAIKRALAPLAVGVSRRDDKRHDWTKGHVRPLPATNRFSVWISSSQPRGEAHVDVEVRFIAIDDGRDVREALVFRDVCVHPNTTTEVYDGVTHEERQHVIAVRVLQGGDKVISRDADWPQPLKYLDFDERGLEVRQDGAEITVTTQRPVKGLWFDEVDGLELDDNAIDVTPGDERVISVFRDADNTDSNEEEGVYHSTLGDPKGDGNRSQGRDSDGQIPRLKWLYYDMA